MPELITQSTQDYLKQIYALTEKGEPANTNNLAARLNVTAASVSEMLNRMATSHPPLVIHKKYQGVFLTEEGKHAALVVIRRHRLLETFLVQVLGYPWDMIHEEACRLEHVISQEFETRMAEVMHNPQYTPHGDPIPSADMVLPAQDTRPLNTLRKGEIAVVQRVLDDDSALLRYLDSVGVVPDARVTVEAYSELDDNLTLHVKGRSTPVVLGSKITAKVFVGP
jgi:DtxR family Mn-dependent transcriptional regulator